MITRRCSERRFLLRPDRETNNAFLYCLAVAAQRFGIKVIFTYAAANHDHTGIFAPDGRYPDFMAYFHKYVANPRVAAKNKWARIEALARNTAFLDVYLEARRRFANGAHDGSSPLAPGGCADTRTCGAKAALRPLRRHSDAVSPTMALTPRAAGRRCVWRPSSTSFCPAEAQPLT